MKKHFILFLSFVALAFTACNDDDAKKPAGAVAFAVPSMNLTGTDTNVQVLFSEPTPSAGTITLTFDASDAAYGTDFATIPAAQDNVVVVPFVANAGSASFTFKKLNNAPGGQNVVFTIDDVSFRTAITGNISVKLNFNETASSGAALAAEVGGPTQTNQVYIDLSSGATTKVPRVSWDLGFYSGPEFRVVLNNSLKMAAKKLETTNIDEVQLADESMIIAQGAGIASQIDNPSGILTLAEGTAIAAVSDNDADNKVYLVNMGNNPSETAPAVGSEGSASGSQRAWKKIRILKSGNGYKIQYADIASTTHEEKTITKNTAYNFSFFSLVSKAVVNVEPQKNQWDLNFTTFTNILGGTTPYYYPDFVVNNLKGGARAYMVMVAGSTTYDGFTKADVVPGNFTEDQRNIGSNWRSTSVPGPNGPVSQFVLKTDRFFVVKDPAGNIYKLRFTGGANEAGERGFPKFQYSLLQ